MPRIARKIEHDGEAWTTIKLMAFGQWKGEDFPRELLRSVEEGERTMKQVLAIAKRRRMNNSRRNFKYECRIRKNGKIVKTIVTVTDIVNAVGISEEAAWRRLKKAAKGERDPESLFDPARSKRHAEERTRKPRGRFSHLSSEMTPERKRRADLLVDANLGLISYNEFSKEYA